MKTRVTLVIIKEKENALKDLSITYGNQAQPIPPEPELMWAQVNLPAGRKMAIHIYVHSYQLFGEQLIRLSELMEQESLILADQAYSSIEHSITEKVSKPEGNGAVKIAMLTMIDRQ